MMKRFSFILLMLIFSEQALSGVTYWGIRANLWQKNGDVENFVYVQGVFDGLIFADTTVHETKLTTDINVVQYIKAIDILYSDYRNALIPVPFLMRVITLELQGSNKETIEKELEKYRKLFSQQ